MRGIVLAPSKKNCHKLASAQALGPMKKAWSDQARSKSLCILESAKSGKGEEKPSDRGGCRTKMKMSAFTKVEMSGFLGCGEREKPRHYTEVIPFIEWPGCAPLRQSQVFSQTLVLGLAESLTLSSLRW